MSKLDLAFKIWTGILLTPFICLITSITLAKILNCDVHEGYAQPCPILFFDIGGLLYALGVSGWLMILSIMIGPIGYIILAILKFITNRKRVE